MPQENVSTKKRYTIKEEIANSITHGIGAALSIAALVILVVYAALFGDVWRVVSFSIYGATLFILYLASTLYHSFTNEKVKQFFRLMDHTSIYLLIAGTYTPITLVAMRGAWGWTLFGLIWGLALVGISYELFIPSKKMVIPVILYVSMGWLVIIAVKPMLEMLPKGLISWIVAGGLFYTSGVVFYIWKKIPFNHAIWHLFVLGGSISHFFGMLFHLLPKTV